MTFSYVLYFNHVYNTCTKQRVAKRGAWHVHVVGTVYSVRLV